MKHESPPRKLQARLIPTPARLAACLFLSLSASAAAGLFPATLDFSVPAHASTVEQQVGPKPGDLVGTGSEPLECRLRVDHTVPSTVCRPFDSDPSPVRVLFRKMPAWGGNADLLLIDMCRYSPEGFALQEAQLSVSPDGKLPDDDPRLSPLSCVRRYCTQKHNSFSIALDGFPLPLGWLSVRLWVGFQYQHFRLACDTLADTPQKALDALKNKNGEGT